MADRDQLDTLVHRADLDDLVRWCDALTAGRDWSGLFDTRAAVIAAVHTGRQLWPIATLCEYRLCLWAPAAWAAAVLDDDTSGRFALGPLTEVAAVHHPFADIAAHLPDGPRLGLVAHERSLRGDDIPPSTFNPLDIPFARQGWEPDYVVATYDDDGVRADVPLLTSIGVEVSPDDTPDGRTVAWVDTPPESVDDDVVERAWRDLFDTWTAQSTGTISTACTDTGPLTAARLVDPSATSLHRTTAADALRLLVWAGADGAAHGRRRGSAVGRFGLWWLVAALADVDLDDLDGLASFARRADWHTWLPPADAPGWNVRLVVHDPDTDYSWAVSAGDRRNATNL